MCVGGRGVCICVCECVHVDYVCGELVCMIVVSVSV